ncbi:hypothetical protein EYF80_025975 [Liparis tanakae]|uniref:Uncharacterized protein n=1 Tax=Liparis tanakae TaxID=230148 RepID=A0A4Z2HFL7_9TELE|nr:hypothetical protein EYF80_025975 [Liparis tanakae]
MSCSAFEERKSKFTVYHGADLSFQVDSCPPAGLHPGGPLGGRVSAWSQNVFDDSKRHIVADRRLPSGRTAGPSGLVTDLKACSLTAERLCSIVPALNILVLLAGQVVRLLFPLLLFVVLLSRR